ncbi:MAG TPA: hypothetical protein VMD59_11805 [Acidimicrobiales bacterium]|nr:hypothetical protein [Acidimicrobiales bacterium]
MRSGPSRIIARPGAASAKLGRAGALCSLALLAWSGTATTASASDRHAPPAHRATEAPKGLGLTRSKVELLFHELDGKNTVFRSASDLHGSPRVLGADRRLSTALVLLGYPEVEEVNVVTLLETARRATLIEQIEYDSLACGLLAGGETAEHWCTGRILARNEHGTVTASRSETFGHVRITVKTTHPAKPGYFPVVAIDVGTA